MIELSSAVFLVLVAVLVPERRYAFQHRSLSIRMRQIPRRQMCIQHTDLTAASPAMAMESEPKSFAFMDSMESFDQNSHDGFLGLNEMPSSSAGHSSVSLDNLLDDNFIDTNQNDHPAHSTDTVSSSNEQSQSHGNPSKHNGPAVYVGSIPFDADEQQIHDAIRERIGDTFKSLSMARNFKTGTSRGFVYVNFNDEAGMADALEKLAGLAINGQRQVIEAYYKSPTIVVRNRDDRLWPQPARKLNPVDPDRCVYLGNVDYSANELLISQFCSEILGQGFIKRVRLQIDRETGTIPPHPLRPVIR